MLDYSKGAEYSITNCDRLETTAKIILEDDNGTDSFALFLYYIAYEEISKAIFCLFVHRGWINEDYVLKVFREHKYKIFLFDEIFKSFQIQSGKVYLGGKELGEKALEEFIQEHATIIKEHRDKTKAFLYVDKNSNWKVPLVEIPNISEEEMKIKSKITALRGISHLIKTKYDAKLSQVGNFKFIEKEDGTFEIQFDAI